MGKQCIRENIVLNQRKAMRMNTLRNPHSLECLVFRKVVNRTAATEDGGLPTLGGMGVLNAEDEHDYTYEESGKAMILFPEQFQTDGDNFLDNDEGVNYHSTVAEVFIEPIAEPDEAGHFIPDKHNLVTVDFGAGVIQSYQISGVTGNLNIPPYARKYMVNPRQDEELGI